MTVTISRLYDNYSDARDRGVVGGVRGHRQQVGGPDVGGQPVEPRRIAPGDDDSVPGGQHGAHGRGADAGRRAGHESDRRRLRSTHVGVPVDSSSTGTPGGVKPNTWPQNDSSASSDRIWFSARRNPCCSPSKSR